MLISDLPVAPAGCEWKQHRPDMCVLYSNGKQIGKVGVEKGQSVYGTIGGPRCSLDTVDHKFAALDLFYSCGLVTLGYVHDALEAK